LGEKLSAAVHMMIPGIVPEKIEVLFYAILICFALELVNSLHCLKY